MERSMTIDRRIERRSQTLGNLLLRRPLVGIFWQGQSEPVEILLGLMLAIIGLWYLLPFATFPSATSYAWIAGVTTEPALGCALLVIGMGSVIATLSGQVRWRGVLLQTMTATYAFMIAIFWLGNSLGLGIPMFATLTGATGWCWLVVTWRSRAKVLSEWTD